MKPTFDNDDYPTEETLETIKSWKIDSNKSICDLLEFVGEAWAYTFPVETGGENRDAWLRVATGGWSGNESLIEALQSNYLFWALCWLESQRGGSHKFLYQPIKEKP